MLAFLKATYAGGLAPSAGVTADLRACYGLHAGAELSWFSTQRNMYRFVAARVSYRVEFEPAFFSAIVGFGHLEPTWESDESGLVEDHSSVSPLVGLQVGLQAGWFQFAVEGQLSTVETTRRDVGTSDVLRTERESPKLLWLAIGAKL